MQLPTKEQALPGREEPIMTPQMHTVLGTPIDSAPSDTETLVVGMGCFWGAERLFWQLPGIHTTAVGYAGGVTPNPTYREVCSGGTGHTEVVRIVYRPGEMPLSKILQMFWEEHDPTQGMRQGADTGTQYRSAVYCTSEAQLAEAKASCQAYQKRLRESGLGDITTEIAMIGEFYFAEDYHQQYLDKNPGGYCGLKGTGVACVG